VRNFLDDSIAEHKSNPPLRWIANWAGDLASSAMLRLVYAEEDGIDTGFRYKRDGYIYDYLWPFFYKYGTMYRLKMDLSGKNWDDYDENGIPYWEKIGAVDPDYTEPFKWDYEDDNGDAFRIINK